MTSATSATPDGTAVGVPAGAPVAGAAQPPGAVPLWEAAGAEFTAWRDGDPGALDRLVRLLTPALWQLARAHGLDREAAEDVVQTSWIGLMRSADSLRDPLAVMRWLTTTTRREAWRVARKSRREDAVEPAVIDAAAPAVSGPEDSVLANGTARSLWRLVARLTGRCQRLLRIIAFEERPDYASLSQELGIPVGGIGPTRGRCLKKLRDLMAGDPEWSQV